MPRLPWIGLGVGAALLASAAALLHAALPVLRPPPLFLAPMLELTDSCVLPGAVNAQVPASLQAACSEGSENAAPSAAQLVAQTLAQLPDPGRAAQASRAYTLGYTLPIPLLQLYAQDSQGQWQLQPDRIERFVHTLRDAPQQAIVYLFSTHFSTHAPIEAALAQDPDNLAHSQDGPIPVSDYLGSPLYAWSVARTDNALTQYRRQAIEAVAEAICQSGPAAIEKVRGITLLGEVHQLFPDFEAGTGFTEPYRISDYDPASVAQFRRFLQKRFDTLDAFNRQLHSAYTAWEQIQPPRTDLSAVAAQTLSPQLHAHLDAYAHGLIPVSGWTYVADPQQHAHSRILVFVDGRRAAVLPIDQDRQDVLEAKPEFDNRLVGWHTMLDFRSWPTGSHRLTVYLQTGTQQPLTLLAERTLTVQTLRPAAAAGQSAAEPKSHLDQALPQYVDLPLAGRRYVYNPMAEQWHAFRQQQVLDYLGYFTELLDHSCLSQVPRYRHLYIPDLDAARDPQKFAVQQAALPQRDSALAVSLYGRSGTEGNFVDHLRWLGHGQYAVSEFHPLTALNAQQWNNILTLHRRQGAQFFSFFLEPVWQGAVVERRANPFSLAPNNPFKGSDQTFESLRQLLQQ